MSRKLLLVLIYQAFSFYSSLAQTQSNSVEIDNQSAYLHEINNIMIVIENLRLTKIVDEKLSDCQICQYGILIDATTGLAQSVTIEKSCGNDIDSLAVRELRLAEYQRLPDTDSSQVTKYYISVPFYFKGGVMSSLFHDMIARENDFCRGTKTKLARVAQERLGRGFLESIDEPPWAIGGFKAIQQQLSDIEPFKKLGIERLILMIVVDKNGQVSHYRFLSALVNGQTIGYKSNAIELRELTEIADIAFRAVRAVKWRPGTTLNVPHLTWVPIPIIIR